MASTLHLAVSWISSSLIHCFRISSHLMTNEFHRSALERRSHHILKRSQHLAMHAQAMLSSTSKDPNIQIHTPRRNHTSNSLLPTRIILLARISIHAYDRWTLDDTRHPS